MPTADGVSIETYLRAQYEPDAEYVNAHIEERPQPKTIVPLSAPGLASMLPSGIFE